MHASIFFTLKLLRNFRWGGPDVRRERGRHVANFFGELNYRDASHFFLPQFRKSYRAYNATSHFPYQLILSAQNPFYDEGIFRRV